VGTARLWDIQTGTLVHTFLDTPQVQPVSAAFSPDSKFVAIGSWNGVTELYDVSTEALVQTFIHEDESTYPDFFAVHRIIFAPDGKTLLTSDTSGGRSWDVQTGKQLHTFPGPQRGATETISLSPTGQYVLIDGLFAKVWDVKTGEMVHAFDVEAQGQFLPDGKYILTEGGPVTLWDAYTYEQVKEFEGAAQSGGFSADGRYLLISPDQDTLYLWDIETKTRLTTFVDAEYAQAEFFPDNDHILVMTNLTNKMSKTLFQVWGIKGGTIRWTITIPESFTAIFEITPDSKTLVTASAEKQIHSWELATGKEIRAFC
jgi:WD40 repeat protein